MSFSSRILVVQESPPDSPSATDRIAALERRLRVQLCAMAVICGLLFVLSFAVLRTQGNDTVTARRFVLCDENRTSRGMISTNKDDLSLSLFDSDGSAVARFAVNSDGRPDIAVLSKSGEPLVRIFEQDGRVQVRVEDENASIQTSEDDKAFQLVPTPDKSQLKSVVRTAGYARSGHDEKTQPDAGAPSPSRKEDEEFSFDPNMQPSTGFAEVRTRRLTLIDDLDNTRALLSTSHGSTDLSLFDAKGMARARFSLLPDGHPEITLRDDLGRPLIRIAERRGAVMLQVQDGRGYGKVILGQAGNQFGIDVSDELGEFGVRLRTESDQPQFAIVGPDNSGIIQLFARPEKTGLSISGRSGEPGAILSMLDNLRPILLLQGEQKRTLLIPTESIAPVAESALKATSENQ
ncbi:MAG: hypothetical protein H7Z17_02720 [Fuerstia sp.]|nr:hypothetical protein [Fuerstiella sp.]